MTTLYVAGPMSGLPDFNYPAFRLAGQRLSRLGFEVLNPADIDAMHNPDPSRPQTWDWYMRHALTMLLRADGVALLDGWESSKGASLEVTVAEALGLSARGLDYWMGKS